SRRRHTRSKRDWSSDVCSSDLAMCVALDPASGHASVVGAGHPPLLVVRDGATESVASVAPPLGLVQHPEFTETTIDFESGDAFRSEERRVGKEWRSGWAEDH